MNGWPKRALDSSSTSCFDTLLSADCNQSAFFIDCQRDCPTIVTSVVWPDRVAVRMYLDRRSQLTDRQKAKAALKHHSVIRDLRTAIF